MKRLVLTFFWKSRIPATLLLALVFSSGYLGAEVTFPVSIEDPEEEFVEFHDDVTAAVQAAGAHWAAIFEVDDDIAIKVLVRLGADVVRATGRSATSVFVREEDGRNIFEMGAAAKLRTGVGAPGRDPDVVFSVNGDHLVNQLWFDPNPTRRTREIPSGRTDAVSVFIHEFGHAFVFNGWIDWETGERPDDFQSTFDALTVSTPGKYRFTGPRTVHLYGGQVPLTDGNIYHFGNVAGEDGEDLVRDVMNGVVFYWETRYTLSGHTLAVAEDLDLPVALSWDRWSRLAFRDTRAIEVLEKDEDSDGNGIPNLLEFVFGTDPRNPRSLSDHTISERRLRINVRVPLIRSVRSHELHFQISSPGLDGFTTRSVFSPPAADAALEYATVSLPGSGEPQWFARFGAAPVADPDPTAASVPVAAAERELITGPTPIRRECPGCAR